MVLYLFRPHFPPLGNMSTNLYIIYMILLEESSFVISQAFVSGGTKALSGIVASLICSTIFLVDKGRLLGLTGWSGVLSVFARYRAAQAYASIGAASAILALRFGQANYASQRDLSGSLVPVAWFPFLLLPAEVSGSNSIVGGCVVVLTYGILLVVELRRCFMLEIRFSSSNGLVSVSVQACFLLCFCRYDPLLRHYLGEEHSIQNPECIVSSRDYYNREDLWLGFQPNLSIVDIKMDICVVELSVCNAYVLRKQRL